MIVTLILQVLPDVNESYDKHYERRKTNAYDNPYAGGMNFTASNAGSAPSGAAHDPFNPVVAPVTDDEINAVLDGSLIGDDVGHDLQEQMNSFTNK